MRVQHIALTALTLGCVSLSGKGPPAPVSEKDYIIFAEPDDTNSRFNLSLKSMTRRPLCMSIVEWPNRNGAIGGGSGVAELIAGQKKLAPADFNFGTCIGPQCVIRVSPGRTLPGFVGYSQFGDPDTVRSLSNKRLAFYPRPAFCTTEGE